MTARSDSWLVFAACLAPRAAALAWFTPDPSIHYYWEASDALIARGALELDGLRSTFLEPVLPAWLALSRLATGDDILLVALLQAIVGALGGVLLFRVAALRGSRPAAIAAAALYAFDPYLVRQTMSFVEVTLCTTLLIGAAWLFTRRGRARAAYTGGILALTVLTRFSLAPIAAIAVLIRVRQRRFAEAAVLAAAVTVPVGAWMLRSHAINGTIAPARIGVNLFVSTNEYARQIVPTRNVDLLVPWAADVAARELDGRGLTPSQRERVEDGVLLRRALAFAREHPIDALGLKLRNLLFSVTPVLLPIDRTPRAAVAVVEGGAVRVEGLAPRPFAEHLLYSASRTILLGGAAVGILRRRRRFDGVDALLLGIAVSVLAVQTVFFPTSRLLAPMAFVLMLYTGWGLAGRGDAMERAAATGPSAAARRRR